MKRSGSHIKCPFLDSSANDNVYFFTSRTLYPARIKVIVSPWGKRIFLGNVFPGIYLTEREAELIQLLEQYKYREIASMMKVSRRTAEYISANLQRKLNCRSKQRLVEIFKQSGLSEQLCVAIDISYLFDGV